MRHAGPRQVAQQRAAARRERRLEGVEEGLDERPLVEHVARQYQIADGRRVAGKESTAKGEAKGLEHLHLVTYTLATDKYVDHGPIFYSDRIGFPTYVNSIAVGGDGWVYALGRMPSGLTDLFRVADPHA